jgi:hypothetical protein
MNTQASSWSAIWSRIKGSQAEVVRSISIPAENVTDSGAFPRRFEAGNHYFAVHLNEMYLAQSRQWFSVYDPMAIVVTEFTYDGQRRVVPMIVGPSLIEKSIKQVPNGMAITDTMVAGVHPYQGGKFVLSVVLAQVRRESYARRLLEVVDKMSTAFAAGSALEPYLKAADAVFSGVESLFGMGDTRAIAGHRWEYNAGITPWLEPGFFALIDMAEGDIAQGQLGVDKGRLVKRWSNGAQPFRKADFLLYSLQPVERRSDATELAFHRMFKTALRDAASRDEGSWERAKAGLVALYQDLLTSPDLTWAQVQELMESYTSRIKEAHGRAESFGVLGSIDADKLGTNVFEIGSFRGHEADKRRAELSKIHTLLALE